MMYALNEWAECCSVDSAINKLIEKYLLYKPILIGFEEVGFQSIYKSTSWKRRAKKGVYLPIKGCSTKGIGKERILSLSPFIENGMLKFKENMNKTIDQLTMYPKSEFDDLQDALYYAWEISQIGFKEVTAFNLTSGFDRLGAACMVLGEEDEKII
ncbi:hypothetical protein [Treponema phagedenis]|uniref:hypothetical protein n=1 Tax=Treponema phagedenis TaxID=162 RepID=UPI00209039DE|nr:hypothetical protein [Treponema phagedenis]